MQKKILDNKYKIYLQFSSFLGLKEILEEYSEKDLPQVSRILVDNIVNNQMQNRTNLLNAISKIQSSIYDKILIIFYLLETANPTNCQLVDSFVKMLKKDAQVKASMNPNITECKGITFNKKTKY